MGKQRRRKGQSKNKSNNNNNNGKSPSNDNNNNNKEESPPSSILLQRIRHADPRTRHAALAAVANTLLDPSSQPNSRLSKAVTPQLLQAIRERVLDSDLDVSQVAAGCLANYVALSSSNSNGNSNRDSQVMTAGWTLVVMGRLQQCHDHVVALHAKHTHPSPSNNTNNNNNNNNQKKVPPPPSTSSTLTTRVHKQWLALAVQCLRTLCTLVETNPEAVARLTSYLDASPRVEFHRVLLEWMQHSVTMHDVEHAAASRPLPPTSCLQDALAFQNYHQQIVTLAARTLHSAWDDNDDLLEPWKEACPDAFQRALTLLQNVVVATTLPSSTAAAITASDSDPTLAVADGVGTSSIVMAQLHCAGALLAARHLVTSSGRSSALVDDDGNEMISRTVLGLLIQQTEKFAWNHGRSLLQQYQQALEAWDLEQTDAALERDVIQQVQDRREPARHIARRQKELKKQQEEQRGGNGAGGADDEDDDIGKPTPTNDQDMDMDATAITATDDQQQQQQHQQQVETREALEKARDAWNQFLMPLQLSLELLANLTSGNSRTADNDHEDDMMMMDDETWGPDQEAKWMLQEQQRQMQTTSNLPGNSNASQEHHMLLTSVLPQQLQQLFREVYQEQPSQVPFPENTRTDLDDLQSKVMACLGNCWENIEQWTIDLTWTELQQAAAASKGRGKEGLVNAMVIALKKYPWLRKQWQPDHVAYWLNQLSDNNNENENNKKASDEVRLGVICMLGVLCSQEPHPVEVNREICGALLDVLNNDKSSLMIACEVLNVLMDMYGNDEDDGCCHVSVFESMQVLRHFQRRIPTLKSAMKERERSWKLSSDESVDQAQLEHWKETLLNASRFVQYKKGQL